MPDKEIGRLEAKIDELIVAMEKMKLAEYIAYLQNYRKMMFVNLLAGIARGLGIAIGFTLLGALVIYLLQKLVLLNLPVIGHFIADLVELVTQELHTIKP